MTVGTLVTAAILGTIVLLVALFLQRGREGGFSTRAVLRTYLYVGSLAGIVALASGLSAVVDYGLARAAGDAFIYGSQPAVPAVATCPPGATNCRPQASDQIRQQQEQQRQHQRDEDLIRGITFTVFGALFWGAHWGARRGLGEEEGAGSAVRRGYLLLGTGVFGLATIVLLPTGVYQALSNAILTAPDNVYRPGAEALGGGIVSLPIWLIYLWLAVGDLRRAA